MMKAMNTRENFQRRVFILHYIFHSNTIANVKPKTCSRTIQNGDLSSLPQQPNINIKTSLSSNVYNILYQKTKSFILLFIFWELPWKRLVLDHRSGVYLYSNLGSLITRLNCTSLLCGRLIQFLHYIKKQNQIQTKTGWLPLDVVMLNAWNQDR